MKLKPVNNQNGHLFGFEFWCPGCEELHLVNTTWDILGTPDSPTINPSVLVQSGHFARPGACWCTYNAEHPDELSVFRCVRCHSFVKAGQIEFLSDCSHSLAGKTVPLPDYPEGQR